MRFKELFDVPYIKAHVDAVLLEELPGRLLLEGEEEGQLEGEAGKSGLGAGGGPWNRTLDALLLLVPPEQRQLLPDLLRALDLQLPPQQHWINSPVTSWLGCSQQRIAKLRKLLQPYRIIAVQTFHGLLYGSQWLAGPMLSPCSDACCEEYKQHALSVRKSEPLFRLADRFVRQRLRSKPFLAVHLRPYPDPCVRIWTQEDTPDRTERLRTYCNNDYLLHRFVPGIQHLMSAYQLSTLFVMSPPLIRPMVREKLRQAGIEPVFMELQD
ncbi:hypothetical protein Agub_g14732, partial [Astrephomene gubernaculifera]